MADLEYQILETLRQLSLVYKDGPTMETIVDVVTHAMLVVESYKDLTGKDKKTIVMESLRRLLDNVGSNTGLDALLDSVIPSIVDKLVVASKNGLDINTQAVTAFYSAKEWVRRVFSACCCFSHSRSRLQYVKT